MGHPNLVDAVVQLGPVSYRQVSDSLLVCWPVLHDDTGLGLTSILSLISLYGGQGVTGVDAGQGIKELGRAKAQGELEGLAAVQWPLIQEAISDRTALLKATLEDILSSGLGNYPDEMEMARHSEVWYGLAILMARSRPEVMDEIREWLSI
jgi:hypothetical protein